MQYRDVFRQPHLVRLWLSQITSAIGDQLYTVAVIWIAVERGNGAAGYVAAAGTFVGLFLNPMAGVLADRFDKRSTMVAFYGAGGFLNIVVSIFKTRHFMFWYCFGWFVFGSGLLIIGRASDLPLACLGGMIAPIGGAFIGLMTSLVIQMDIPREHLGKVFSLAAFAVCLGDFLGLLLAPILYSMVDARDGISISALLPVVLGISGMIKFRQGLDRQNGR